MSAILLRRVRPLGRAAADVLIRDGRVERVGQQLEAPADADVVDCRNELLLPGFVDAHAHLDKTLWGLPWRPHSAEPGLAGLIENERVGRVGLPSVAERAGALLREYSALGTTSIRSHVDVDPEIGLTSIEGVLEARDGLGGAIDVQVVAFPQAGLLTSPGTSDLLEEALRHGADCIGGIDPAGYERDPVAHLDRIFGLADAHGVPLDLHLHDRGELGAWQAELIVERTRALGLGGRVTISHAFFLGTVDERHARELLEQLSQAGVSLATVAPGSAPVPPLHQCKELGIPVGLGCDGIRDLWSPFGVPDLLERAMLLAWRSGHRRDDELELALEAATFGGASVLGLDGYGVDEGCAADLVVVAAETPGDAMMRRPARSLVLKQGRIVAGNFAR